MIDNIPTINKVISVPSFHTKREALLKNLQLLYEQLTSEISYQGMAKLPKGATRFDHEQLWALLESLQTQNIEEIKTIVNELLNEEEPIQLISMRNLVKLRELTTEAQDQEQGDKNEQEEEDDEEADEEADDILAKYYNKNEETEEEGLTMDELAEEDLPNEENVEQFLKQMDQDMGLIDQIEENDPLHTGALEALYGDEREDTLGLDETKTDVEKMKMLKHLLKINKQARKQENAKQDEEISDTDSFNSDVFDEYQDMLDEETGEEDEEDEEDGIDFQAFMKNNRKMEDELVEDDEEIMEQEEAETEFQKQEYELLKQMENLEDGNVAEKAWQESGEVLASQRSKDSLIREELDFQQNSKKAPIITEEHTQTIEEIIIHRIMNMQFDDPIPINDTTEQTAEEIELNSKKSKRGLGELYEEAYLETVHGIKSAATEEDEQVALIKMETDEMVAKLLHTLNSMSSFAYMAPPDTTNHEERIAKLRSSQKMIPTTDMEDGPLNRSETSQNAPQEMMKPVKHLPIGQSERTKEDRKRMRARKKRSLKKKTAATKEFVHAHAKHLGDSKTAKKLADSMKSKLAAQGAEGRSFSSSKTFFTEMQQKLDASKGGSVAQTRKMQREDDERANKKRRIMSMKM